MKRRAFRSRTASRLFKPLGVFGAITVALVCFLPILWGEDGEAPWKKIKKNPPSGQEIKKEADTCLECHGEGFEKEFPNGDTVSTGVDRETLSKSVHGAYLKCTSCHTGYELDENFQHVFTEATSQAAFRQSVEQACRQCHADVEKTYAGGAHDKPGKGVSCVDCHGFHGIGPAGLASEDAADYCGKCHEPSVKAYEGSVHAGVGLACTDCHGAHAPSGQDPADTCGTCHADATEAFGGSVHGKGGLGCADCHGSHEIEGTGLDAKGMKDLCGRCHDEASSGLAASPHLEMDIGCKECHGVHEITGTDLESREMSALCGQCHEDASKGLAGSPHMALDMSCKDCHGVHEIRLRAGEKKATMESCAACHEEAAESLRASAHGKGAKGPGCAECHDVHRAEGSFAVPALTKMCGACHEEAGKDFRGSAHEKAGAGCAACHGAHETKGASGDRAGTTALCKTCHGEAAEAWARGAHGVEHGPSCASCHNAHRTQAGWPAERIRETCSRCHEKPAKSLAGNVHDSPKVENDCAACHGAHETQGGAIEAREVSAFCLRCHRDGIGDYDENNVHEAAVQEGKDKAPDCIACHGGHGAVAVESAKPDGWGARFLGKECEACHEAVGDVAGKHDWLFQKDLHFRGNLDCAICHARSPEERGGTHILATGVEPVRDCEACHTPGGALAKRLAGKEKEGALFTDQAVLDEVGYVMGATRLKILDIIGGLIVLVTFAGMFLGHGGLRFLASLMGKKK